MYLHDSNVSALIEFDGGLRVNYQGTWQGNWAAPGFEWRSDCTLRVSSRSGKQFGDLTYCPRATMRELTRVAAAAA